jgi:hypothetical protein
VGAQMWLQDVHSFLPGSCWGGVYVLPPSAYPKATLTISVEEFGVATGGGVWVAAGA